MGGIIGLVCFMFLITPMYCSTAKIYIRGTSSLSSTLADLQLGTYLSNDYEIIFKSRPILDKTIKDLKLDVSHQELGKMINVSTVSNTRILNISCTSNDAELSRDIANSIVKNGINTVNEIDAKQPYVLEQAAAETKPVSLSLFKTVLIGASAGALLSCLYIFIKKVADNKIETSQDLECLELAILGTVPESDKNEFVYKKGKNRDE